MGKMVFIIILLLIFIVLSVQAPDYYIGQIKKIQTNACLHVYEDSQKNGGNIALLDCQKEDNFYFQKIDEYFEGKYFFLRGESSKKCMRASRFTNSVTQRECKDSPEFQWWLQEGWEGYLIINQRTDKCLDVHKVLEDDASNVIQNACDDPDITEWEFFPPLQIIENNND